MVKHWQPATDRESFVALETIRLLVDLAKPQPGERALCVGLFDPKVVGPIVKNRTSVWPDYLPARPEEEALERLGEAGYEVILCAPFSGRSVQCDEEFWIERLLPRLGEAGRLAVIVPAGMLSNYSQWDFRKFLLGNVSLRAIAELPFGLIPDKQTRSGILLITCKAMPCEQVRMVFLTQASGARWDKLALYLSSTDLANLGDASGKGFVISGDEILDFRFDPQYYDPAHPRLPEPPPAFRVLRLGSLVEVHSGRSCKEFQSDGIPFIQASHITEDGRLDYGECRLVGTEWRKRYDWACSEPGEILITTTYTSRVALLTGDPVCVDASVLHLRITECREALPEYLAVYLRSPLARSQIKRFLSGGGAGQLSGGFLKEIQIYLPSIELQREIASMFYELNAQQTQRLFGHFLDVERMRALRECMQVAVQMSFL